MMNKKLFLKLSLLSFGAVALSIVFSPTKAEAAECRTSGDVHGYAGLIVNSRYKDYETGDLKQSNDTKVKVSTYGGSASGGNVVRLGAGPEGVAERRSSAIFRQINLSYCDFNTQGGGQPGDTKNVVLGHNISNTSRPDHTGAKPWAIDCDASIHGIGNEQRIEVTGVGVPTENNTRGGGTWNSKIVRPPNGGTTFVTITYIEPPPPDVKPQGTLALRCRDDGILLRNIKDENSPNNATSVRIRVIGHGVIFDSEDPGKNRVRGDRDVRWPGGFPKSSNNKVELLIRNITPNNNVNNDGRRLITKNIDCGDGENPDSEVLCDVVRFRVGSGGTLPNGNPAPDNRRYAIWVNDGGSSGDPPRNYQTGNKYSPENWSTDGNDNAGQAQSVSGPGEQVSYNLKQADKLKSGTLKVTYVVFNRYIVQEGPHEGELWTKVWKRTTQTAKCYTASCSVDIGETVPGAGGGSNDVRAGESFPISVNVTNTGDNTWKSGVGIWNSNGADNWNGNYFRPYDNSEIYVGETVSFNATFTAPNNQSPNNFNYIVYAYRVPRMVNPGLGALDCNTNIDTYKEFDINPAATSMSFTYNGSPDVEEPNELTLGGHVDNGIVEHKEAKVDIPVTGRIIKNPGGGDHSVQTRTYHDLGSSDVGFTASVSNPQLGDEYCGEIIVAPAAGWEGPGGHRYVTEPSDSDGFACSYIANRPYLRAYGADVSAGSRFIDGNGACNANPSPIKGYLSSRPNKSGAGSQLAAIAMQTIEGFRTASLRTSAPTAPDGLSFGNEDPADGHYQGSPICSTDFYNETQADEGEKKNVVSSGSLTPHSHPGYDQTLYDGNLVLNGTGGSPFNGKKIIYVNGNVRITGDIAFNGFADDPLEAPSFTLVASGNIYISKNVNRLDGIYVAQVRNDGSGGGTIYTCSKPTEFDQYRAGSTELLDNCYDDAQLTVNGAFIANDVEFLRVYKSVRDSEDDHLETASNTDAAEVFNYSPEIYLSPPPFAASSSSIDTQFYTTLPPIL